MQGILGKKQEIKNCYEQLNKDNSKREVRKFILKNNRTLYWINFYLKFRNKSSKLLVPIVKRRSR